MAQFSLYKLNEQPPFETSRFPGWELRVGYLPHGEVVLAAKRKSDGKVLRYSEPLYEERDYPETMKRLADKLGGDFLELVPMEPRPEPHHEGGG